MSSSYVASNSTVSMLCFPTDSLFEGPIASSSTCNDMCFHHMLMHQTRRWSLSRCRRTCSKLKAFFLHVSSQTTNRSHNLSVALQEDFLNTLRALQPDLCLTAAYGNYLPTKFLSIPKYGTVNIHPSLLPKYRGAAPVQRALQVRP